MKTQTLTILAVLGLLSCANPAEAQQSVTYKKGQLEQVRSFTARQQIQIIDERPRVSDLRRAEEAQQNFVIPIGPVPGALAGANQSVRMTTNRLTPSGFGSNISAQNPVRALNQTKMGGLTPAAPARPIGAAKTQTAKQNVFSTPAVATIKSTPAVATYSQSRSSLGLGPSQFSSQSGYSKEVLARLRHGK